ncbi:cytochrome c biogenesis protein [Stieleria varia]|uniref:Cytochrome c biogenesis protein CcsA n=1 Tax=Stieleria varia TaxID=2528005 RepID=A0A5C6AG82_9BACT|nr:cytochrome c biogenesis protein CcsA [Stieleria varia]TWT98609.1 Cytochrome c biogenesis protein CcsA [Stieleria varia]
MATVTNNDALHSESVENHDVLDSLASVLRVLGSLKITVALFACSLILVLVGTLAQDEMNMQDVKQRYFVSWIARMHVDDFFPQAFYPHTRPFELVLPFPGGALIGTMLLINLIAAKVTRFKIHAKGNRLVAGLVFLAMGAFLTTLIVFTGHNAEGLQGAPPMSSATLWRLVQVTMGLGVVGLVFAANSIKQPVLQKLTFLLATIIGMVLMYTIFSGNRIDDPGLRIVWQLTKGLGAGLVLMVGCMLVFDRQGGNVLLHLGVALLMVGQFQFGDRQLEQRISLVEGDSTNTLVNLDQVELTLISKGETDDEVIAIPGSRLIDSFESKTAISDPTLPVDVRVLSFYENSKLADLDPNQTNPATKGIGTELQAVEDRKHGGTDSEVNVVSAYIDLIDKESGASIGTYLVSQLLSDRKMLFPGEKVDNHFDSVTIADTEYQLGLKYHREVKPYWVQLEDVRRTNYAGTSTPRDYSSFVRIIDPETGEDRRERIWMNNPLRYRGETFFQSSYTPLPSGKELTGLQVVRNSGWLIPYVACSITSLGMLVHFLGTLNRFVGRRERELRQRRQLQKLAGDTSSGIKGFVIAAAIMAVFAVFSLVPWTAVKDSLRPQTRDTHFDLYAAGKIPTKYGGRVLPLDAYARQALKAMSNRESLYLEIPEPYEYDESDETKTSETVSANNVAFTQAENSDTADTDTADSTPDADAAQDPNSDTEDPLAAMKDRVGGKKEKISALQWLMEVAIDSDSLQELPMFRIDSDEIRTELGLERRKSKLYSLMELRTNWSRALTLMREAGEKDPAERSFKEKKLMELQGRFTQYVMTAQAFQQPFLPSIDPARLPPGITMQDVMTRALQELASEMARLSNSSAPAIIPPSAKDAEVAVDTVAWQPFASAAFEQMKAAAQDSEETIAGVATFESMLSAYRTKDHEAFNKAVDQHIADVQAYPIPRYSPGKVRLERWMNSNWPTGVATVFYIIAVILGLIYFATGFSNIRTATTGVLLVTLIIHTIAILSRIYITGRAPVINIYSSAVFIGWAAVVFGMGVEQIFKQGFGNILAATSGMLTLLVAYGLSSGDTMPVLQAVLDTQFWLATHVISVSLGYVATLVAGMLGIGLLVANWSGMTSEKQRNLYRMIYGASCFGILFSFVGTVLGGLWADDSWGRFWGWDPKENGALLIVIWNALMLHARWDGMVKDRGFAILAIGGNIVTAWSWFGTNELGIGLHSYGFTQGVLMWLSIFVVSQLTFLVAGLCFWRDKNDDGPIAPRSVDPSISI